MRNNTWQELIKDAPELKLVRIPCPCCGSDRNDEISCGIDFEYYSCSNVFYFVKCVDCRTVFLNPRPRPEDFGIIYPKDYYSFVDSKKSERHDELVQKVWDILERARLKLFLDLLGPEHRKILDLGCGFGRLLKILRKYGPPDWDLVGVEFGLADHPAVDEKEKIKIYRGFFEDVIFEEAPFNLIIAQQVIEHAYNPSAMLKKIYDNLALGGYAVIDTPDFNGIDRVLFSRGYWGGYHFPRHMTLFTPQTISKFAESFGFEIVKCTKMVSPVFWILSLRNSLVGNGFSKRWVRALHYQNLPLICASSLMEIVNLLLFKRNSNMRVILRKPC